MPSSARGQRLQCHRHIHRVTQRARRSSRRIRHGPQATRDDASSCTSSITAMPANHDHCEGAGLNAAAAAAARIDDPASSTTASLRPRPARAGVTSGRHRMHHFGYRLLLSPRPAGRAARSAGRARRSRGTSSCASTKRRRRRTSERATAIQQAENPPAGEGVAMKPNFQEGFDEADRGKDVRRRPKLRKAVTRFSLGPIQARRQGQSRCSAINRAGRR